MQLRQRMLVIILGSILVILAGVIAYISTNTKTMAVNSANALAAVSGEKIGSSVKDEIENAMDTARTLAGSLQGMKNSGLTNRPAVNAILKQVLQDNPDFLATWTIWEPNAFDGLDKDFVNADGADQTGRLLPYWSRTGSTVSVTALTDYDKQGAGDYYLLPRNSGNETILDPYLYKVGNKEVLMTSLVVPIKIDNKVVGAAGIDIALDQLQTMMQQFKLYKTGFASIYSNGGFIVTSPQVDQIGKNLSDVSKDPNVSAVAKSIHDGTEYKVDAGGFYKLFTPFSIGGAKTPWSVAITIPTAEIMADSNQLLYSTILAGFVALILLAVVLVFLTNAIVNPIKASVALGERMAQGDFTLDVPEEYLRRKDEIGTLAKVFQNITKSMRTMIGKVSLNASQVAAASQQISASAEELAGGSTHQAEAAQNITDVFKELSVAINVVAQSAGDASELTNRTVQTAQNAGRIVDIAVEGMNKISAQMASLEQDSNKIGEIANVIDEIADQTNLLALNAAIEAARAGEQGRGFAVVADEVRKLAERSGEATDQITAIIKGMQQSTKQSVASVIDGVDKTKQTGEAFNQIIAMVNDSAQKVTEIAAASQQQSAQAEQVLQSVESIAATSQEAAAASQETSATSQSLAQLAQELNTSVVAFKVSKAS